MSKDNTRNSAIAVDVRFRSGKSPHAIVKHIILVRLQTQNSIKDFDEGIAVAYARVDSGHFVCLTMVDWL